MSLEQTTAVGRAARLAQLLEARDAALEGVVALDDPLFLDRQTGRLHGGAEVVFARNGGVKAMRAGEEGDGVVAEIDEMTNGLMNAGGVVEENGAGLGIVEL